MAHPLLGPAARFRWSRRYLCNKEGRKKTVSVLRRKTTKLANSRPFLLEVFSNFLRQMTSRRNYVVVVLSGWWTTRLRDETRKERSNLIITTHEVCRNYFFFHSEVTKQRYKYNTINVNFIYWTKVSYIHHGPTSTEIHRHLCKFFLWLLTRASASITQDRCRLCRVGISTRPDGERTNNQDHDLWNKRVKISHYPITFVFPISSS
jgi:hypothetical protein